MVSLPFTIGERFGLLAALIVAAVAVVVSPWACGAQQLACIHVAEACLTVIPSFPGICHALVLLPETVRKEFMFVQGGKVYCVALGGLEEPGDAGTESVSIIRFGLGAEPENIGKIEGNAMSVWLLGDINKDGCMEMLVRRSEGHFAYKTSIVYIDQKDRMRSFDISGYTDSQGSTDLFLTPESFADLDGDRIPEIVATVSPKGFPSLLGAKPPQISLVFKLNGTTYSPTGQRFAEIYRFLAAQTRCELASYWDFEVVEYPQSYVRSCCELLLYHALAGDADVGAEEFDKAIRILQDAGVEITEDDNRALKEFGREREAIVHEIMRGLLTGP